MMNVHQSDMPSLLDYNNYLEKIETIIFNLTHDIDVEKTKEDVSLPTFTIFTKLV